MAWWTAQRNYRGPESELEKGSYFHVKNPNFKKRPILDAENF